MTAQTDERMPVTAPATVLLDRLSKHFKSPEGTLVKAVDDITLEDDTTANDVEEWDSLSHVRLIVAIERHYGLKFANSEIETLQRFGDIIQLVLDKSAA